MSLRKEDTLGLYLDDPSSQSRIGEKGGDLKLIASCLSHHKIPSWPPTLPIRSLSDGIHDVRPLVAGARYSEHLLKTHRRHPIVRTRKDRKIAISMKQSPSSKSRCMWQLLGYRKPAVFAGKQVNDTIQMLWSCLRASIIDNTSFAPLASLVSSLPADRAPMTIVNESAAKGAISLVPTLLQSGEE